MTIAICDQIQRGNLGSSVVTPALRRGPSSLKKMDPGVASQTGMTAWGVLTGPEGGFTPEERRMLRALPYVIPVSLGPRILRAETAVIAALSIIQSVWGDWRGA